METVEVTLSDKETRQLETLRRAYPDRSDEEILVLALEELAEGKKEQ